ncbi:MAG: putative zinc-binding metallopeptidase, partial [Candidatus Competibacteraceae bacterium]|nr:putative zinc-binding metallopeptidase [Candidatus Competibacteraceae bacterium]
ISTYASCHPWEDWAETWAHYLHMVDTLETARDFNIRLNDLDDDKTLAPAPALPENRLRDFEGMRQDWLALTFALNGLNRSMGLQDLYPFVLSSQVVDKLRFVHRVIEGVISGVPEGGTEIGPSG